jgi:colanic acid/amylovoran biosynthesis protein
MANNRENIVIIDQPLQNRGDEAAHRSLMRALDREFPNASFTVLFFQQKEKDIQEFVVKSSQITYLNVSGFGRGISFIERWSLRLNMVFLSLLHPTICRYAKHIKNADIVICAPGGISMGGLQNWRHLFNLFLAKYYKKEIVYYSRSFGPFPVKTKWNRVFKNISLKLLNEFDFLSIRDERSMRLADELNLSYFSSIDTALLDTPAAEIPDKIINFIGYDKFIVFVPNSLTWNVAYKNRNQDKIDGFFIEILKILLARNMKIVMLPQLTGTVSYSEPDYGYFLKLKTLMENNNDVIVIEDIYSSDIQQKIIAKAECVIGARYHSIVFAINNCTPFISLSYEHKMTGLLNILGLNEREVNIADIGKNNFDEPVALTKIRQLLDSDYSNANKIQIKAREIATKTLAAMKKFIQK